MNGGQRASSPVADPINRVNGRHHVELEDNRQQVRQDIISKQSHDARGVREQILRPQLVPLAHELMLIDEDAKKSSCLSCNKPPMTNVSQIITIQRCQQEQDKQAAHEINTNCRYRHLQPHHIESIRHPHRKKHKLLINETMNDKGADNRQLALSKQTSSISEQTANCVTSTTNHQTSSSINYSSNKQRHSATREQLTSPAKMHQARLPGSKSRAAVWARSMGLLIGHHWNRAGLPLKRHQLQKFLCLVAITLTLSIEFAPSFFSSSRLPSAVSAFATTSSGSGQRFEAQPEREYLVPSGHEVRLRCLVRERQGECLWLRNGLAVGNIARKYKFERQPEDGDCSMLIKNVSVQQDDGKWQCQVTPSELDQDTLQSREIRLIVLVAPESPQIKNTSTPTQTNSNANQFNLQRANSHLAKLVLEESKVKHVLCEMRGGNPEPRIEWHLDGRNVTKEAQSSSFGVNQAPGSTATRLTQSRLKLADVRRSMNGKNLTCVGIHQTGNQSTSAELDVQYLPTVSVVQREYSIVEGSPLSISCQVDANPPPNLINWRLVNDNALGAGGGRAALQATSTGFNPLASSTGAQPRSEALQATSSSGLSLPTRPGPILEFERISRDLNQNVFECLAQNAYGISLPADVKLNVLYAPYLVNTSNSESVPVGSDAQLACIFDGNPEPEIKWFYTDPLSRVASAAQLSEPNSIAQSAWDQAGQLASVSHARHLSAANSSRSQQFLNIKNVTYRNEGDYHCEARNQINGVYYGVRSSNIILDVFGEPQFLMKSPMVARAIRGSKSDVGATFCSDPAPNKVYWQFGSIRLEVRLNNSLQNGNDATVASQQQSRPSIASLLLSQLGGGSTNGPGSPSGGAASNSKIGNQQQQQLANAQAAIHQRFQVHPLQPIQRRDSAFSKTQTCFEAKLTLLDPELTDERDYVLTVQNERGHQSATVRLQVSSPLSPVLIISSGLITICAFFLLSLVLLFFVRTRQAASFLTGGAGSGTNGGQTNGIIANGNGIESNGTLENGKRSSKKGKASKLTNGLSNGNGQTTIMNSSVEHLATANGNGYLQHQHNEQQSHDQSLHSNGNVNGIGDMTGQTNGVVNGLGSGHANQASNLNSLHHHSNISILSSSDRLSIGENHMDSKHQQNQDQSAGKQHASMSSSSEISSHGSANDQRQLLASNNNSGPQAANNAAGQLAAGLPSPGISSIGSQMSSTGSTGTTLDNHTNVDFNVQTSTLASSNSISSAASSTILRSPYNNNNSSHNEDSNQDANKTTSEADGRHGYLNRMMSDIEQSANVVDEVESPADNRNATYRAAESVLRGVSNLSAQSGQSMGSHLMMMQQQNDARNYADKNAIIYANIDCSHEAALANLMHHNGTSGNNSMITNQQHTQQQPIANEQLATSDQSTIQFQSTMRVSGGPRSKVGATIAMMNSLAAQSSPSSAVQANGMNNTTIGALNGAMRQHQFTSLQKQQQQNNNTGTNQVLPIANRKQGPPKPPKPIIQQASRFYQQAAAAAAASSTNGPSLNGRNLHRLGTPTRDELAAEYSRLAFPERAEL